MTRLNWKHPRGSGHRQTGQTVDSIGLDEGIRDMLMRESGRKRTQRLRIGGIKLREKAKAGDRAAQAKLAFGSQKSGQSLIRERKIRRKIYGEPNQTKVPKGCVRMQKRDPDTGEINIIDLPVTQQILSRVLHCLAGKMPWRHHAPQLTNEHAEFLLTGRWTK